MKKSILVLFHLIISFHILGQDGLTSAADKKKYAHHQTYESFLAYLKQSTGKMASESDKLTFIRNRVAEIVDIGAGGKDISLIVEDWEELDGKRYYDFFYGNTATVKCGGTSYFLSNIYTDLGYESDTYDMGCPGIYTHQVTIVKNNQDGQHYVQDAFYNVSYYTKGAKGSALGFAKMIELLKEGKANKIKTKYDAYLYKQIWDTTGLYQQLEKRGLSAKYDVIQKKVVKMERRAFVKKSQAVNDRVTACLKKNNFPKNNIYFYLLPLEENSPGIMKLFRGEKIE